MRTNYIHRIARAVAAAMMSPETSPKRFEHASLTNAELRLFITLLGQAITEPTLETEAVIQALRDVFEGNRSIVVNVPI